MLNEKIEAIFTHSLCRAKRVDNGVWVYGFIIRYLSLACSENYVFGIIPEDATEFTVVEIDPDTIGCYIGITDINKQKIFTDDIVRYIDYRMAYPLKRCCTVELHKGIPIFKHGDTKVIITDISTRDCDIEIVGNCFDRVVKSNIDC